MSTGVEQAITGQRDKANTVSLGPNRVTFLLSGEQTGGQYSLTEFVAAPPPAPAAPVHVHTAEDETVYVIEGEFEFIVNEQAVPAPAGSFIRIPRGTPHTVANVGLQPGRLLVLLSPPGFEGYWAEMAQLLAATTGQPDPAQVLALQEKYHFDTRGQARQFNDR